ncbi:MAG: sulfoxide reductase heme-binding subunit YedZ [Kordiimonadales bacterium]|nr:MAG: sulfoxide reductase heme-binding subunit YedZ [Kordiimonadales bacterium]
MKITTAQLRRYGKPVAFLLLAWPALWLGYNWYLQFQYLPNGLGFNPQEATHRWTGDWAMRFLILSLALTPLSKVIKSPKPILFRRMVGVYAFFYVCLHLVNYVWLDKFFAWGEIWLDILKRNYITIGMICFLLLIPLAVTSTKGWVKRMGARRWQKMHKLSYVIAPLVIVHFFMMRKGFQIEPLIYGAVLAALLAFRLPKLFKR